MRLERKRCRREACGWARTGIRTRHEAAGRNGWRVGSRLLGMRLGRSAWRVTLATEAGSARRSFRVR